jgi:hypothetical protein
MMQWPCLFISTLVYLQVLALGDFFHECHFGVALFIQFFGAVCIPIVSKKKGIVYVYILHEFKRCLVLNS